MKSWTNAGRGSGELGFLCCFPPPPSPAVHRCGPLLFLARFGCAALAHSTSQLKGVGPEKNASCTEGTAQPSGKGARTFKVPPVIIMLLCTVVGQGGGCSTASPRNPQARAPPCFPLLRHVGREKEGSWKGGRPFPGGRRGAQAAPRPSGRCSPQRTTPPGCPPPRVPTVVWGAAATLLGSFEEIVDPAVR